MATASVPARVIEPRRRGALESVREAWRHRHLVPFFGHPAPFPTGPFVLARATGVPIVRAFCLLRPDRRYAVTVLPPLRVSRGGEAEAARTWVASLEAIVRAHPTQWFNFFDVWRPFGP